MKAYDIFKSLFIATIPAIFLSVSFGLEGMTALSVAMFVVFLLCWGVTADMS